MAGNIFDEFARRARGLVSPQFKATLAQRCGEAAVKLEADCFQKSETPYGEPWAPLALRKGGRPLRDTGDLARSIHAQPGQGTFRLVAPRIQAALQNYGGTIVPKVAKALAFRVRGIKGTIFAQKVTIPARQFFPDDRRGLPKVWQEAFAEEYAELVKETLGQ